MRNPGRMPATAAGGEGGGRAGWGTISRRQIVDAAIAAIRAGGEERLTIRGLAASLGVAPMSLYHHVRSRDDLLDDVVGVLLAEAWRPALPEPVATRSGAAPAGTEGEVRAWLTEAADRFRLFLVEHPVALHVYLRHPVVSEAAIGRMEAMLRVLGEAGLAGEAARRAYGALHTYTVGFAALEASRRRSTGRAGERAADDLARRLAAYTTHEQFLAGLDLLLDGVIGRAPTTAQAGGRHGSAKGEGEAREARTRGGRRDEASASRDGSARPARGASADGETA